MARAIATLAPVILLGGAALAEPASPPAMDITLTPSHMNEASGEGSVSVEIAVSDWSAAVGAPLFRLGVMAPGMRDQQPVTDFAVSDADGAVPIEESYSDGVREWRARRAIRGAVRARYVLPISNVRGSNPPVAIRIDGDAFSSPGRALIAAPTLSAASITLHWRLAAMGPGAQGISSYGDGDVALGAGPIDRVGLALFMAGHVQRLSRGNFAAIWAGELPFDPRPSMEWTARLHKWMGTFFGDKTEPPYRVFLRGNPQNPGGGAAMTHSFIVGYGVGTTGEKLIAILGHEMTHTWTAVESLEKWYSEGNAVYYQVRLPWRAGLTSTEDYLKDVNETASRYYTNAKRSTPEAEVLPHFWEDTRIRVLPYDRGALYFAALNGMVKRKSGGGKSIDDLIFAVNAMVAAGKVPKEADWLELLSKEAGPEGVALHRTMMAGGLVLPRSDDYGPCFRRVVKQIRQFDLGFDNASLLGDTKIIRGLVPGSEAQRAGLKNGDRILSIDAGDAVQRDVTRMTKVTLQRDGQKLFFTYLPRGKAVSAYQWERVPEVPDGACRPASRS